MCRNLIGVAVNGDATGSIEVQQNHFRDSVARGISNCAAVSPRTVVKDNREEGTRGVSCLSPAELKQLHACPSALPRPPTAADADCNGSDGGGGGGGGGGGKIPLPELEQCWHHEAAQRLRAACGVSGPQYRRLLRRVRQLGIGTAAAAAAADLAQWGRPMEDLREQIDSEVRAWLACDHCGCVEEPAAAPARRHRRCGGCGEGRYCSRECQQAAWPAHRAACRQRAGR
jgi:hypothetical protein